MFLNGYLAGGRNAAETQQRKPKERRNDLTGATELRFYARGEQGGEWVEFFTCGFGYDGDTGEQVQKNPDSEG